MVAFYFSTTSTDTMGIFSHEKFPGYAANRMPKMEIAKERWEQVFKSESQQEYEFVKDVLSIVVRPTHAVRVDTARLTVCFVSPRSSRATSTQ